MSARTHRLLRVVAVTLASLLALVPVVLYTDVPAPSFFSSSTQQGLSDVVDDPDLANEQKQVVDICARLTGVDQVKCLESTIFASVENGTYAYTRVALDEARNRLDSEFYLSCHSAMHDIGGKVLSFYMERDAKPLSRPEAAGLALSELDSSTCGGSMAHGVIESVSISSIYSSDWLPLMKSCSNSMAANPSSRLGCGHAIGHGLVDSVSVEITPPSTPTFERRFAVHKNRLLPELMARCQELSPEGSKAGSECAYGAFMQVYDMFPPNNEPIVGFENFMRLCEPLRPDVRLGCASGVGLTISFDLGMKNLDQRSLHAALGACSFGPVVWVEHPYSPSTTFICQAEVLNTIQQPLSGREPSYVSNLCASLEDRFGPGPAIRCILEIVRGNSEEDFRNFISLSGALGTEALKYVEGEGQRTLFTED